RRRGRAAPGASHGTSGVAGGPAGMMRHVGPRLLLGRGARGDRCPPRAGATLRKPAGRRAGARATRTGAPRRRAGAPAPTVHATEPWSRRPYRRGVTAGPACRPSPPTVRRMIRGPGATRPGARGPVPGVLRSAGPAHQAPRRRPRPLAVDVRLHTGHEGVPV